ncbi:MAG: putative polysaccharide biosynthesis protein [Cellulosilyticaceae bacterium]
MEKDTAKQGIIKGAMILAAATFISKIVGMLYRIPVTNILGDTGNAIYGQAYNVYIVLLTLSAVGIPSAISRLVSERIAVGAYRDAQRVYKVALIYSTMLATILGIFMWSGAEIISQVMVRDTSLTMPLKALSPTIVIVTIMAVMRGYFQGMNNMAPSGISQVIEQVFNAIFSVVLAYVFIGRGITEAATGSTLGTGVGALAGLIFMIFVYYMINGKMKKRIQKSKDYTYQSNKTILKQILWTTIPIVLSTSVFSLMMNVDSFMLARMLPQSVDYLWQNDLIHTLPITNVMQFVKPHMLIEQTFLQLPPNAIAYAQGNNLLTAVWSIAPMQIEVGNIATSLVGQYFGKYFTLVNVPVSLILTMGTAAIPAIAMGMSVGNIKEVRVKTRMILKIGMLLAMPSAVGIALFAKPIMALIFSSQPDGGELLAYGAISILFITVAQLTTGVLQGMGKQQIPTIHATIACIVKVVLNVILLSIPGMHIYAVIHSTTLCYLIYAVLNVYYLKKQLEMKFNWRKLFIKPALAAGIMGIVAYGIYSVLCMWQSKPSLWLLVVIPVAGIIYGIVGILIGAITTRDLENIPGGKKIINHLK